MPTLNLGVKGDGSCKVADLKKLALLLLLWVLAVQLAKLFPSTVWMAAAERGPEATNTSQM